MQLTLVDSTELKQAFSTRRQWLFDAWHEAFNANAGVGSLSFWRQRIEQLADAQIAVLDALK